MKETPRRWIMRMRIMVILSSLHGISTDQLGNRVVVRGRQAAGFWTDI
jgi:hypothetical protein